MTQAKDAAELVEVDVRAAAGGRACARRDASPARPLVWDERAGQSRVDAEVGDKAATDAAFARAAHVVRFETWINRVTGVPMEPRAAVGDYDAETAATRSMPAPAAAWCASAQTSPACSACRSRSAAPSAATWAAISARATRFFPEYALLPWAAKTLGRPVKWIGDRSECFLTDYQGRDLTVEAELALDEDGRFLGMRGTNISNLGAYTAHFAPLRKGPRHHVGRLSHPGRAFPRPRGGHQHDRRPRPIAAPAGPRRSTSSSAWSISPPRAMRLRPVELRRRNFVPPDALPYTNALGITYDNGEYERGMDAALRARRLGRVSPRARPSRASAASCAASASPITSRSPAASPRERAEVTIEPDGSVELVLGTMNSGQGHETSFAQLVDRVARRAVRQRRLRRPRHGPRQRPAAARIPAARCASPASPSARRPTRSSRRASRSPRICSRPAPAISNSPTARFAVKGTDRRVGIFEVAKAAATRATCRRTARHARRHRRPDGDASAPFRPARMSARSRSTPRPAWSSSCGWAGVDDVGRAVNPMILHGQTHGARGAGHRPGAAGAVPLRPRERADAVRLVHGLRHAARRRSAVLRLAS